MLNHKIWGGFQPSREVAVNYNLNYTNLAARKKEERIGGNRKKEAHSPLMEHPQMISPWQSYCNTKGGVFIGPFCTSYCLILPWLRCRRDHFRLQKCRKIRDFNVDFWKKFPDPTPLGAPALRASTPRSGPSVPPSSVPERFAEILAPGNIVCRIYFIHSEANVVRKYVRSVFRCSL